jgi:hypothetical protein
MSTTDFVFLYPFVNSVQLAVDAQPPSVGRGGAWAPEGTHYLAPHDASPFFTMYRRDEAGLVEIDPLPFSGNSDIGWCGAWNAAGTRLAVGMRGNTTTYPFVAVFSVDGDTFTPVEEIFDAAGSSLKRVQSLSYHEDGAVLATVSNQDNGVSLYSIAADVYTKVGSIGVTFSGSGVMCGFFGDYLACTTSSLAATGPFKVCKLTGTTLSLLFENTTDDFASALAWSSDGQYVAAVLVSSTGRPVMRIYERSGDVVTLSASAFLTDDGTDTGATLDPQAIAFTSTHLLASVRVGNKVLAYEIGTFDRDVDADILLPETSDQPAEFSLVSLVTEDPPTPPGPGPDFPCEEIGPVSRVDVSAHNRTRQHSVRVLPGERRCLVANFNGAVPASRTITAATWRMDSTVVASMSDGKLLSPYRQTEVSVTAALPGTTAIECRATFDNGEVYSQRFMVEVEHGMYSWPATSPGSSLISLSAP